MSIANALNNAPRNDNRRGPSCDVCAVLATADPPDAEALRAALTNPQMRYTVIAEALAATDTPLSSSSLSRHARGRCLAKERLR
jgi:hypothetical protein